MVKKAEAKPGTRLSENPVRLMLPAEVHQRLRVIAAENGLSMASYARELVIRHVEDHAEKKK